ncbi:hypothetical protein BaRGS_00037246 [Batillaria attramentaria]|uniref:Uncharacterized protein n=1 Tax=Batillaria attramentaria TaxID=370345 RepID=A0ABD0J955_9CAEN
MSRSDPSQRIAEPAPLRLLSQTCGQLTNRLAAGGDGGWQDGEGEGGMESREKVGNINQLEVNLLRTMSLGRRI